MKKHKFKSYLIALTLLVLSNTLFAGGSDYWQGKGRIAISSDGNMHDNDDWAATAATLMILAKAKLQNNVVLYTYSDHIWGSQDGDRAQMKTSAIDGGVKFAVGGRVAELEGGEAVINKRSTAMFRGQLSEMNAAGGGVRFADGGVMPGTSNILQSSGASNTSQQFEELANNIVSGINTKEVIVSEASITGSQTSVAVSELTSTIF